MLLSGSGTLWHRCFDDELHRDGKAVNSQEGPRVEQASTNLSLCPHRTTSPASCGKARRGKFVPQLGYILLQITSLTQDLSPPDVR